MPTNRVYLSLGSNHNAALNLKSCLRLLRQHVVVLAVSPVYETAPVGDGNRNYLNAAVVIETQLDAVSLKESILRPIEQSLGRDRTSHLVAIDLDIVLFNQEQFTMGKRQIPDPDLYEHAFIAIPLADIAPNYVHPITGDSLYTIAQGFTERLQRRNDIRLT